MDLSIIGYLLFIIPGFCFVWTYRHFTKASEIGEFEYTIWSFLWGTALFLLTAKLIAGTHLPTVQLNDPFSLAGAILGIGLAITTGLAFPLGYVGALFSRSGLFGLIDKGLFLLMEKPIGVDKKTKINNCAGRDKRRKTAE